DQLESCCVSGQRLPRCELVPSATSGKLVAADLAVRCPVSGDFILETEQISCPTCRQSLSPNSVGDGQCRACHNLSSVRIDDPRLEPALARYPQLANWKKFRLSQSDVVTIVIATGLLQQRLIVLDKITGQLCHAAQRSRLSSTWVKIDEEELVNSLK
ncbi:MAG: hypothetical protein N2C12_17090, partial [Planctomycetales bacterium]